MIKGIEVERPKKEIIQEKFYKIRFFFEDPLKFFIYANILLYFIYFLEKILR